MIEVTTPICGVQHCASLELVAGLPFRNHQVAGSCMEHDAARWLASRLGYNAAADATLSSNCRGNLKGLWEFIITNYKTADSKRHIRHVLDKHRREQEAAARAPEQRREAEARRQRLHLLRKRNADLEQTLTSLQVCQAEIICNPRRQLLCAEPHVQHGACSQPLVSVADTHGGQGAGGHRSSL